ncbi:MAG: T9SS type A sorting domain-containing protein [Bacteroidota bacterium]
MKRFTSVILISVCLSATYAQSYISNTMQYDNESREYDIYVPATYDGTTPVPLIFNFHGGNGDIASQIAISDMSPIADTATVIVVYPQALPDPNDGGSTNWIHKDPTTVDDVFFIDALIDTLSEAYNIDQSKMYACGYSLGGEFTYELSCRLNRRIAAIGVVARTMQTWTLSECSPVHKTGVLTILGTADFISNYNGVWWGGIQYYLSADEVHEYWGSYNSCDTIPDVSQIPNTDPLDGSTVERYVWSDSNNCSYVEHLKVIEGGHDWPGSFGNMDINATQEIWNFVSRYDTSGLVGCTTTAIEANHSDTFYSVYPNPFTNRLTIEVNLPNNKEFNIYSMLGELLLKGRLNADLVTIDVSAFPPNMYILNIDNQSIKVLKMK